MAEPVPAGARCPSICGKGTPYEMQCKGLRGHEGDHWADAWDTGGEPHWGNPGMEPVPAGAERKWRVDVRDGKVRFALNGTGWPEDGYDCGAHGLTDEEIDETIVLVPESSLEAERARTRALEEAVDGLRLRDEHAMAVSAELQAEVERLREALKEVGEQACREWIEGKANYCYEPAEVILWGKLLKPEALGPRCYDCAAKHIGHRSLTPGANFALFDLRPFRALCGGDSE